MFLVRHAVDENVASSRTIRCIRLLTLADGRRASPANSLPSHPRTCRRSGISAPLRALRSTRHPTAAVASVLYLAVRVLGRRHASSWRSIVPPSRGALRHGRLTGGADGGFDVLGISPRDCKLIIGDIDGDDGGAIGHVAGEQGASDAGLDLTLQESA